MSPLPHKPGALKGSFRRWVHAQNTHEVLAASSVGAWLALVGLVMVLLAATQWAPGASTVFNLSLPKALLCFLPALVDFAFAFHHRGRQHITSRGWVLSLVGTTCLQFFVASLMTLSALPGATLFGGLFLFTAAFHGQLFRVTPRAPFLAVGTALALALAAGLFANEEHLALFAVIGPASIMAELYLGTFALRHDRTRAEAERLRAAVQAQMLEQQEKDVGRMAQALTEILGHSQDLHNALQSAGTSADLLLGTAARHPGPVRMELDAPVRKLRESLALMRERLEQIRQRGRRHVGGDPEVVELVPVLDSVRQSVSLRFPEVDIQIEVDRNEPLRPWVRGGTTTLRRVVENLVTNACEGDGVRAAARVRITARTEPYSGRLEMLISDNGPGFAPERLAVPIQGLSSSKPQGTGVGLYTSECLIRASGGQLERQNAEAGGAVLRVLLPQEFRS
ncbi:sensor histidine kinase [Hyalangium rubrum]|uniref:histidine kinase n=1 Tax=Hyalangium rubrum TaxID=3103134 RepID=A0ABU5GZ14_9BACT|nr:ATP-binding protein [Hyalangium sp. s54d21]MDY7226428.1 ATP-binding protein [Hyalangium sp. s54d21]